MSGTRLHAVKALSAVLLQNERPKKLIEAAARDMEKRDRAFLMEIVYGVLRYRDTLDWILGQFLKHPARLTDMTINNLRIAVYQLYHMRVPEWAVVNESVEIEKTLSKDKKTGMQSLVNAVLRNVIRRKEDFRMPLKFDDPVTDIAVNTSHPPWMVKRWLKRYGENEAAQLAYANNILPPLTIRVNSLRTTRDQLLSMIIEKGIPAEPSFFSPDGVLIKENVNYDDLSFAQGLFVVQDEASQMVPHLLGPKPGERILDACAAPGGKTTHIAQLTGDTGELISVDRDAGRLLKLEENVKNLGIKSVKIINADINVLTGYGPFDRILLDAPCSATGVIRRNPDVKYRHMPADLQVFREKQLAMLRTVAGLLKDGGVLVYSVCSIEPEEGEEVINDFLKTGRDFRIIDAEVVFLKEFMKDGFFRTFPHRYNMDGFFGVALCRTN
jgi:16S rRNA (cytosine967-C5)-methyltransferase